MRADKKHVTPIYTFSGGENHQISEVFLKDNQCKVCKNYFHDTINVLKKRGGFFRFGLTFNDIITSGEYFKNFNGNDRLLITAGNALYDVATNGTQTLISSALNPAPYRFAYINNQIIMANNAAVPFVYNEEGFFKAGLTPPAAGPTVVGTDQDNDKLRGKYKYQVTFVYGINSRRGESNPSPATIPFETVNKNMKLTGIAVGAVGSNVTARRIYRTPVAIEDQFSGEFRFVAEIPDNTTTEYIDSLPDEELEEVVETDNWPPEVSDMVIEWHGRVFYIKDNTIRYSKLNQPESVPVFNKKDVDDTITMCAKSYYNLIMFTKKSIYQIEEYGDSLLIRPLYENIGCVAAKTVKVYGSRIFFVGTDDVYIFSGGQLNGIGRNIWDLIKDEYQSNMRAVISKGEKYIISYGTTGKGLIYDIAVSEETGEHCWTTIDNIYADGWIEARDDTLFWNARQLYIFNKGYSDINMSLSELKRDYDSAVLINTYLGNTSIYPMNYTNQTAVIRQRFPVDESTFNAELKSFVFYGLVFNATGPTTAAVNMNFRLYNPAGELVHDQDLAGTLFPSAQPVGEAAIAAAIQANPTTITLSDEVHLDYEGEWRIEIGNPNGTIFAVGMQPIMLLNAERFTDLDTENQVTLHQQFDDTLVSSQDGQSVMFSMNIEAYQGIDALLHTKPYGRPQIRQRFRNLLLDGIFDENVNVHWICYNDGNKFEGDISFADLVGAGLRYHRGGDDNELRRWALLPDYQAVWADKPERTAHKDIYSKAIGETAIGDRIEFIISHNTIGNPEIYGLSFTYFNKQLHA